MPISHFLRTLYPQAVDLGEEDHPRLTLWTLKDQRSRHLRFSTPQDLEIIAQRAETLDAEGQEVYFGVGLRRHAPSGLGFESEVSAWPGFWVDVDIAHNRAHPGVEKKGKHLPPDLDAVEKVLDLITEKSSVSPSVIVHSGYGVHVYYLFDEPVAVLDKEERAEFKAALKTFQRQFGAAMDIVGKWHLDPTAKLQQVLRLPGTTNRKVPVDPKTVEILVDDGDKYTLEQLSNVSIRGRGRPAGRSAAESETVPRPGGEAPNLSTGGSFCSQCGEKQEDSPSGITCPNGHGGADSEPEVPKRKKVKEPEPNYPDWVAEVRRRFKNISRTENFALVQRLAKGESFAERGGRNETCNRLCGVVCAIILRVKADVEAEEVYENFFAISIDAMAEEDDDPENPALSEDVVKDQIDRSLQDLRDKKAEHDAIQERVEESIAKMLARGRAQNRRNRFKTASTPALDADELDQQDSTAPDSADEILETSEPEVEEENKVSRLTAQRSTIIQFHTSFYVWKDGRYQYPVPKEGLETKLRDDLPHCDWEYENEKGELKRKTLPMFLRDYCTVARRVVFDLTIDAPYYDHAMETFFEAVSPVRDLQPEYNEQIDTWLRVLGGKQQEKLFDWVATVTDLNRQSCALYLSGDSGTGKTMLAHGLARLWTGHGPPTELDHALKNFNDSISHCPLLVADEALPSGCTSAQLRHIIGTSSRTMTRKYLPGAPLVGAVRLMLMANNDRMLQTGEEEQDSSDIAAVAGRFLHIKANPQAADYLASLGGRAGTNTWVDGDAIAKHALWMATNMRPNFKSGSRFLVEGHKTRVHRQMILNNHAASVVCEWLVKYLLGPMDALKQQRLILVSRDKLMVNSFALANFWDTFVTSHKVFTLTKIGRGLNALSFVETSRVENKLYHNIDLSLLFEWAEVHGVADAESMKLALAQLAGPVILKT